MSFRSSPCVPDGVLSCGCTSDTLDPQRGHGVVPTLPGRERLWSEVEAHVAPHLGPLAGVLHDAGEGRRWADLIVHAPGPGRPSVDLVTAGVSVTRMPRPRALRRSGAPARVEFVLRLVPGDERGPQATLRALSDGGWAYHWLHTLPRLLDAVDVYLGDAQALRHEERMLHMRGVFDGPFDAMVFARGDRHAGALPPLRSRGVRTSRVDDTVFRSVIPLYTSEYEFGLEHGVDDLFARLADAGVSDVAEVGRATVA